MNESVRKFRTFEDLDVYRAAREFRKAMLLNGYIRYLRERKAGESLAVQESAVDYGVIEDDADAAVGNERGDVEGVETVKALKLLKAFKR